MAFVHGKNAVFSLDNAGGTLQNLSAYADNVSGLPGSNGLSPVTVFGNGGEKSIPGLENITFSASGSFDPALIATLGSLRGADATATFEYGPAGSGTGMPKFSGECWLTEFAVDATVADKVTWSATFQVDGVVTVGAYA